MSQNNNNHNNETTFTGQQRVAFRAAGGATHVVVPPRAALFGSSNGAMGMGPMNGSRPKGYNPFDDSTQQFMGEKNMMHSNSAVTATTTVSSGQQTQVSTQNKNESDVLNRDFRSIQFPEVNFEMVNRKKSITSRLSPNQLMVDFSKFLVNEPNVDVWVAEDMPHVLCGRYFGDNSCIEYEIQIYTFRSGSAAYVHKMRGDSWVNLTFEAKVLKFATDEKIVDSETCTMNVGKNPRSRGMRKLRIMGAAAAGPSSASVSVSAPAPASMSGTQQQVTASVSASVPNEDEIRELVDDIEEGYEEISHASVSLLVSYLQNTECNRFVANTLVGTNDYNRLIQCVGECFDAFRVVKIIEICRLLVGLSDVKPVFAESAALQELSGKWAVIQKPFACVEIYPSITIQRLSQQLLRA